MRGKEVNLLIKGEKLSESKDSHRSIAAQIHAIIQPASAQLNVSLCSAKTLPFPPPAKAFNLFVYKKKGKTKI